MSVKHQGASKSRSLTGWEYSSGAPCLETPVPFHASVTNFSGGGFFGAESVRAGSDLHCGAAREHNFCPHIGRDPDVEANAALLALPTGQNEPARGLHSHFAVRKAGGEVRSHAGRTVPWIKGRYAAEALVQPENEAAHEEGVVVGTGAVSLPGFKPGGGVATVEPGAPVVRRVKRQTQHKVVATTGGKRRQQCIGAETAGCDATLTLDLRNECLFQGRAHPLRAEPEREGMGQGALRIVVAGGGQREVAGLHRPARTICRSLELQGIITTAEQAGHAAEQIAGAHEVRVAKERFGGALTGE